MSTLNINIGIYLTSLHLLKILTAIVEAIHYSSFFDVDCTSRHDLRFFSDSLPVEPLILIFYGNVEV